MQDTKETLNIEDGSIYYSYITGIIKSNNGSPGEKKAEYDENQKYGNITKNTTSGIFGNYTSNINNDNLISNTNTKTDCAYFINSDKKIF